MFYKLLFLLCLAFVASCSEDKIESKPEISLEPSVLEFSDIPVSNTTNQILTIKNVGDLALEVNSISIDSSSIFTVLNDSLPLTLESGSEKQIEVSFTPQQALLYEGKLSVLSNAEGGSGRMTLRGKGIAQTFVLETEIDTLDFGTIVFPNEITKNLKIKNIGNSPVRITNISFTPEGDFETALVSILEIPASDSSFINYTYKPQAVGQSTAEMSIFSSEANPEHVIFTGKADAAFSQIKLDTEQIEFENTELSESRTKSITITNDGNSELIVSEISFYNGTNALETNSVTPIIVMPNDTSIFEITFSPESTFEFVDSLKIVSNSETDSVASIPISGVGISQELDLLTEWLTGSFSSEKQAQNSNDPYIYDVRMKIVSIWSDKKGGHWVYVEQAQVSTQNSPYRQRIYHLLNEDGNLFDRIYRIPSEEEYVGSWETPSDFDGLNEEDLTLAEGCDVHFSFDEAENKFRGNTIGEDCSSSISGVEYLTSETSIFEEFLTSWDLGWNASGDTVLGPSSPYEFEKIENFHNPLFNGISVKK